MEVLVSCILSHEFLCCFDAPLILDIDQFLHHLTELP